MAADRPRPARRTPGGATRGAAAVVVLLAAGLLLAGAPPAPEPPTPEPAVPGASAEVTGGESEPGAVALLARADRAARRLAYEGTQVVARWSGTATGTVTTTALLDVRHEPGRGSLVRPVSALPTPAGSGAPESVVPDPARPASPADGLAQPAAAGAPVALLERHYVLRRAGDATTAGREAAVVEAVRRSPGAGVRAARFWLDRETGLVLRREVADATGRTVLASAFLDLRHDGPDREPDPGSGRGDAAAGSGAPARPDDEAVPGRDALAPASVADLRAEGWAVPAALGGLDLHEARAGGEAADRLVHLAYSDGLVSVSVFQQPGDLDAAALAGWERRRVGPADVWVLDGLPQRVAWASGGTVHTVLADGPAGTVEAAVAGLPHEGEAGGARGAWESARERLARGLTRLGAWVEPSRP